MLLWAPLPFGAVYTWAWASITILTSLISVLWMTGSIQSGKLRIAYTPIFLPIVIFLALGGAQLVFHLTTTPTATRESLLKLTTCSVLLFAVVQLFADATTTNTWRRMGVAVLTFGFIFSFLSDTTILRRPPCPDYMGWT